MDVWITSLSPPLSFTAVVPAIFCTLSSILLILTGVTENHIMKFPVHTSPQWGVQPVFKVFLLLEA